MVRSKGERTAMWVVLAILILGPLAQLVTGGFDQLTTFRFWFALYGWLALGLIVGYGVYLLVAKDDDAVAAMMGAAGAETAAGQQPAESMGAVPAAPAAQG